MLVEIAIGDAYGAGFEYAEPSKAAPNDLLSYRKHPRHDIRPGCYTDDTQMAVAVSEAMLATRGSLTREALAQAFVTCFKRDMREGYAARFYDFLKGVRDAEDFLSRIHPRSEKSGAAMRASPIGLLPSVEAVKAMAALQAKITHDTAGGIQSATAAALMTHYFYHGVDSRDRLASWLSAQIGSFWSAPHRGKVGSRGMDSVRAALTAIRSETSLSAILRRCIDFTGDVDTVAAVALGAASCARDIAQDLPAHLYHGLENGPFGREYLIDWSF
jgi:ADP-ribosyl-[dinitrogen reductase] hydrolase